MRLLTFGMEFFRVVIYAYGEEEPVTLSTSF